MSQQYDADAPEGSNELGSQYVSKKDWIWILAAIIVLAIVIAIVSPSMKKRADESNCKSYMHAIASSISQYAVMNDGFPPLYAVGENGTPALLDGKPIVWASVIPPLPRGSKFTCPATKPGEAVRVNGKSIETSMFQKDEKTLNYIDLSYGMFSALSARKVSDVANDDQTILLAETANHGAHSTYNPLPFTLKSGTEVPFDGFAVGFNDSNGLPTAESKFVTRLAFPNTKDGIFNDADEHARHGKNVFAIFVDGHLGRLVPTDMKLKTNSYMWMVR
ncbi:MAG: hypothetical protein ACKVQS_08160 [Fimbriimonadaceae bacterium]